MFYELFWNKTEQLGQTPIEWLATEEAASDNQVCHLTGNGASRQKFGIGKPILATKISEDSDHLLNQTGLHL